jgi:hypothetical protein
MSLRLVDTGVDPAEGVDVARSGFEIGNVFTKVSLPGLFLFLYRTLLTVWL